jgi:hypothetical protein
MARFEDEKSAAAPAAGGQPEGNGRAGPISRSEVAVLLASVEAFDRKLEASRKVLESLAAQLGALARLSFNTHAGAESVVPRLVEMHNSLSNIHSSLEDSFESLRTRYAGLRDRCAAVASGCTKELEAGRRRFEELGRRMEGSRRRPAGLFKLVREENALFSSALDSYNAVLTTVSAMRDAETRVNDVFNDFSETIGRIDGLSRTMGEFISTEETRAFEEELELLRKNREEKVRRYIR